MEVAGPSALKWSQGEKELLQPQGHLLEDWMVESRGP